MSRVHRYPKAAQKVAFNPVGQIVGAMNEKLAVRDVIYTLVEEYVDAVERLQKLQASARVIGTRARAMLLLERCVRVAQRLLGIDAGALGDARRPRTAVSPSACSP